MMIHDNGVNIYCHRLIIEISSGKMELDMYTPISCEQLIQGGNQLKSIISTAIILAYAGFTNSAHADWQYTKWGMSPSQVAQASKGKVIVGTGDPGDKYDGADVGATGSYASGEYQFHSVFYFVNNKLVDIRLELLGSDGYKLKNTLDGIYGKPFYSNENDITSLFTYHDTSKNNRIDLFMIGKDNTSLEYRPLKDESAAGL